MWNTKCNYKRNESDTTCPLCKTEEENIEDIMVCQEGNNTYNLLDENEKDWEKQLQYTTIIKKIGKIRMAKRYKRKRYTRLK